MPRKRLEFTLTRPQAFIIGTGGILALLLSFIIGMLVGKEMQGSSILERDVKSQVVKMKVEPLPPPPAPVSGDVQIPSVMKNNTSRPVITFYDTLTKTGKKGREPLTTKATDEDKKESSRKSYTIQVGAMKDKTLANGMVSKLRKYGYSAYLSESGSWYKIRLGTFYNKEDAKKEAVKIKKNERLTTTVVEK